MKIEVHFNGWESISWFRIESKRQFVKCAKSWQDLVIDGQSFWNLDKGQPQDGEEEGEEEEEDDEDEEEWKKPNQMVWMPAGSLESPECRVPYAFSQPKRTRIKKESHTESSQESPKH